MAGVVACEYGFRNDAAEAFALATLSKYGGELVSRAVGRHGRNECFFSFDCAWLKPQNTFFIHELNAPTLHASDVVGMIIERVRNGFIPLAEESCALKSFLNLLVSDREEVRWFRTNPITRIALIISLSYQAGVSEKETLESLAAIEKFAFAKLEADLVSLREFGMRLMSEVKT